MKLWNWLTDWLRKPPRHRLTITLKCPNCPTEVVLVGDFAQADDGTGLGAQCPACLVELKLASIAEGEHLPRYFSAEGETGTIPAHSSKTVDLHPPEKMP